MSLPRVGIIGSGQVAQVLAKGFQKHGYRVALGTRDPLKLADFQAQTGIAVLEPAACAASGEVILLAVKGAAAEAVVSALKGELAGKVVLDATNPIADAAPVDGILPFFTDGSGSLMERLQARAPEARFVKAFSCVGSSFMVDPAFPGGQPTMFIAGDDAQAKAAAAAILTAFGWEAEDMGLAASARPIEALCQLWCAPGLLRNQWTHAFKLLKL